MKADHSASTDDSYAFDPEIEKALTDLGIEIPIKPAPVRGEWKGLRDTLNTMFISLTQNTPIFNEVSVDALKIDIPDGNESIDLYLYKKKLTSSKSLIIYVHGGGRIAGSVEIYEPIIKGYVNESGVAMLAVDYRLSPEVQGAQAAEDVFAALKWVFDNADQLGVDADRIAVMGDSAGGGIAAAVAIMARDADMKLARQILIYPMLDDRTIIPDTNLLPFMICTYDNNYTGWFTTFGKEPGSAAISPLIAPARLNDFQNLAPAYLEVGYLDIFRKECIDYVEHLSNAGVPVEFHLRPGTPHAFEALAPESSLVRKAMSDRLHAIRSI